MTNMKESEEDPFVVLREHGIGLLVINMGIYKKSDNVYGELEIKFALPFKIISD